MVRPVLIIVGAIPAIVALAIAAPLLSKPDIPLGMSVQSDALEIEYTKNQLQKISHGVTERTGSLRTEVLSISDDGMARYSVTGSDYAGPGSHQLDEEAMAHLLALIKDTGFMTIPDDQFPVREDISAYQRSSVKITLNGAVKEIHWPDQNATDRFIPPIITMVQGELDGVISNITTNK